MLDKPEETLLGYRDCQEDTSGDKDKTEEEKNLRDISTNFRNIDSLKNWNRSFLFIVNRKRLVRPLKLSEM